MSATFEDLFNELDEVNDLLNEGPGTEPGDSEAFLGELVTDLAKAYQTVQHLTAADVDAEFTEEGQDNGEENSNAQKTGSSIGLGH